MYNSSINAIFYSVTMGQKMPPHTVTVIRKAILTVLYQQDYCPAAGIRRPSVRRPPVFKSAFSQIP